MLNGLWLLPFKITMGLEAPQAPIVEPDGAIHSFLYLDRLVSQAMGPA